MNCLTFEKTGVEVLRLGMQRSNGNVWPLEHWQTHRERWRLFSPAIEAHVSDCLAENDYGGGVAGLLIYLEIADFRAWPLGTFSWGVRPISFSRSSGLLRITVQLMWPEVGNLGLAGQLGAYTEAVLASVDGLAGSKRIPKGFDVERFRVDLALAFRSAKPSRLTRTSFVQRNAQR